MTQYSEAKTNALDNIKYLAQSIYGQLPKDCKYSMKEIELGYSASGSFSQLTTLENPFFVTHVMVGRTLSGMANDVYISASADNSNDLTAINLGTDGDVRVGGIWKYLKVSGNASSGGTIKLTLTGYELTF